MSISRAMTVLAERDPTVLAVRDEATVLSRAQLEVWSNALARHFQHLGVGTDDLITVALPNTVEFVVAAVAAWKAGATVAPLSPRLPAAEIDAILALADPALIVGVEHAGRRSLRRVPDRDSPVLARLSDDPLPDAAARSWKAPTSSGSTGRPKIIVAAASAHIDPDTRVAAFLPRHAVQLVAGPLSHSAPFTYAMRGLMTGHSLVLLSRFDERRWLSAVDEHRVTWAMLVPTMMSRILRVPAEDRDAVSLDSLESVVHVGAPCPSHVKRAWIDWLGPERVTEVYAGTESNGITTIRGDEWLEHPGSVGRPSGGSSMKVVGVDGVELPHGEVGEIMMKRSGELPYSYLGTPTRLRDGWDSLGDTGKMDADGYLYVLDRLDDLIVSGGVKVYPAEVEAALERHPAVRSVAAFGVPDDDRGEAVHAIVDVADAAVSSAEVMEFARHELDPEKIPRRIEITRAPVRDDAGKVRRARLRSERS